MTDPKDEVQALVSMIDTVLPGARRYAPVFSVAELGFGISYGGGLSLISSAPEDPWFLNMTAGILHSLEDIEGALAWVNERNSNERFGRYYCSVPAEDRQRCNVVYQVNVFSTLFEDSLSAAQNLAGQMTHLVTDVAVKVPPIASESLKGLPFHDGDEDLGLLVAASFG